MYAPIIIISPCAMLMTPIMPKMMMRPMAERARSAIVSAYWYSRPTMNEIVSMRRAFPLVGASF